MTEREMMKLWVDTWKQAGPELERIRLQEVRDEDVRIGLLQLGNAINFATRNDPPSPSSGLVEMQRYFAKLRS